MTHDSDLEIISSFVVKQLPDSISERRKVLSSLLALMPFKCKARTVVQPMLLSLSQHMKMQQEFTFQTNEKGNGE